MGKHAKKQTGNRWGAPVTVLIVLIVLVCIAAIWNRSGGTRGDETQPVPGAEDEVRVQVFEQDPVVLGEQLRITRFGSYSGIYMEDGSDEIVTGVMMIVLENTSEQDLQLARIQITYPGFTAEFEVTSLPAGESVAALERSRQEMVSGEYLRIQTKDVVFFEEPMSLYGDRLEITGAEGSLDVRNISGEDIQGDFYIYYKNSADDLLYGGITYRVRVEGGVGAGETVRVMTGHYSQGNSRILMVTGIE